eukprot:11029338-Alexandrium_andersonii.AAC.1
MPRGPEIRSGAASSLLARYSRATPWTASGERRKSSDLLTRDERKASSFAGVRMSAGQSADRRDCAPGGLSARHHLSAGHLCAGACCWRTGASGLWRHVAAGDDKTLRCVQAQWFSATMQE